ncbi:MAG: hypothetical protein Q4A41_05690, partial [Bacillota bacterium]|nr:hypothetical protein [Bacillota bacterium]
MRAILKRIKSEKGSALIWALVIFTVVSIATTTVLMIQSADIKEVQFLENRLTAYYASVGGMEFGLAALMSAHGGTSSMLFDWCVDHYDEILDDLGKTRLTPYTYVYKNASNQPVAEVLVSVYAKNLIGEQWIVVEAVGKDLASGVHSTNYLRINKKNVYEVHRDGAR